MVDTDVILMNADPGTLLIKIFFPSLPEQIRKRPSKQLALIGKGHGFVHAGNLSIEGAGQRKRLSPDGGPDGKGWLSYTSSRLLSVIRLSACAFRKLLRCTSTLLYSMRFCK